MQAPVPGGGTGHINPRGDGECAANTGNIPWNRGGCSPLWTAAQATCVTVEHVGRSSRGGGEGGVLGQEAEGRGQGDLAIGTVVLPGNAGDNGVFDGNGTLRSRGQVQ